MSIFERLNRLFPVWAILFALCAAWQPEWFTGLASQIKLLLAIIMFAIVVIIAIVVGLNAGRLATLGPGGDVAQRDRSGRRLQH